MRNGEGRNYEFKSSIDISNEINKLTFDNKIKRKTPKTNFYWRVTFKNIFIQNICCNLCREIWKSVNLYEKWFVEKSYKLLWLVGYIG